MARRNRKVFTAEERAAYREAKRTEQRERLEDAVSELASSEGWRRWVASRSMFHRYSFGNSLLIAAQRPDATIVASYATWKRAGRQVLRGQTGIAINVPAPVKVRTAEQRERMSEQLRQSRKGLAEGPGSLGGELPEGETRMMFKVGHIFDVSQTEGQELPQLKRHPIEGDSHAEYIAKLQTFAGSIGFRVEWRDLSDDARGGWCDYASKLVVADSSVPANAKVRVLVHEVAHALGVSSKEYGRELAEVIVETAAVVVCGSIGLDTTGESVPYVAGWADGDASKVREYAEAVDSVARKLEDAIGIDEFAVVRGCVVKSVAKGAAVWSRPTRRGQCGAVASAAAPPQREARIAMDCPNCGLELWTSREGCAGLGVSRKSWASWRNSSTAGFPAPIGELGGRPVWDAAKVQAWAENRPRLQQS